MVLYGALILAAWSSALGIALDDDWFGVLMALGALLILVSIVRFSYIAELFPDGSLSFTGTFRSFSTNARDVEMVRVRWAEPKPTSALAFGSTLTGRTWIWNCRDARDLLRGLAAVNPSVNLPTLQ